MAVAGPLVTLGLFALSLALGVLFASGSRFSDAALIREGATTTPALALVGWLAFINGALLLFNIIPAFPLDGGRIARAAIWWRTGDRNRATLITGRAGQAFALLIGLLGLVSLFGTDAVLGLLHAAAGVLPAPGGRPGRGPGRARQADRAHHGGRTSWTASP